VNFQSNVPITITYQFSCIVYIKYICITGLFANVNNFSYVLLDINQQNVGQGTVTRLTPDQCTPRPLPTAELANQVIITIDQTNDGQPPKNIVIDMQACFLLSVSLNMNLITSSYKLCSIFLLSHLQLHLNYHCFYR
jgi:hypothetical protein